MDLSSLGKILLSSDSVDTLSQESGSSKKDVKSVISAALPLFLQNGATASRSSLTKAAGSGSITTILNTLLGKGGADTVAESSGVSAKNTKGILGLLGPLLMSSMLGGSSSGSSANASGNLLSSLLGGSSAASAEAPAASGSSSGLMSILGSLVSTDTSAEEAKPAAKPSSGKTGKKTGKKTDAKTGSAKVDLSDGLDAKDALGLLGGLLGKK